MVTKFLTFEQFITQDVLIFFYYVGAVVMPVVLYVFRGYLAAHIGLFQSINVILKRFYYSFSSNEKVVFWMIFVTLFLCMELCWRMVFEAMIGYFDMHNDLREIADYVREVKGTR